MCEANSQNIDMCELGFSRSNLSCLKFQMMRRFMFFTGASIWSQHATWIFLEIIHFPDFLFPLKKNLHLTVCLLVNPLPLWEIRGGLHSDLHTTL